MKLSAISFLLAKFACVNFGGKLSDFNSNSWVVIYIYIYIYIYISWSWSEVILFSISLVFVLQSVFWLNYIITNIRYFIHSSSKRNNTRYFVFSLIYFKIKSSIGSQVSNIRYFIFNIFILALCTSFLRT